MAYLNNTLSTHCPFTTKGLHISVCMSMVPRKLSNFISSHQAKKQDTPAHALESDVILNYCGHGRGRDQVNAERSQIMWKLPYMLKCGGDRLP